MYLIKWSPVWLSVIGMLMAASTENYLAAWYGFMSAFFAIGHVKYCWPICLRSLQEKEQGSHE